MKPIPDHVNTFIDTNVILSFYHLSSDDLGELKKLAILMRQGKVWLFMPEQVLNEFRRNRANKIADAIKRFRKQKLAPQIPQLCRQYKEYNNLRAAHKDYAKYHAKLIERMESDAARSSLEADAVIEELSDAAKVIPTTSELVEKARLRMDLGNPPGKKGSLGDAINWEALLQAVPQTQDLNFISNDKHYFSSLDLRSIDPYLSQEWSDLKGSNVNYYKRLSSFFQDNFPHIEFSNELEKDLLIQELASTYSFSDTHAVVLKLSSFSDFTQSQVNEIVTAAVSNNQIYWIAHNFSVRQFLSSVVQGREDMIDPENLKRIKYVLEEIEPYEEIPF